MKNALPLTLIIPALVASATAETSGPHGSHTPPPASSAAAEDPAAAVRTTAAAFLAGYLKKQADHHLCQVRLSGSEIWIELGGLRLSQIAANPASPADATNGFTESWLVLIDYTTYRTRNPRTALWSAWSDSPNLLLPTAIRVERAAGGPWQANPKDFQLLTRFSPHGDPAIVPHDARPAIANQASK